MTLMNQLMIGCVVVGICKFSLAKPKRNHEAIFLDAPSFVNNKPQITAEDNGAPLDIKSHGVFASRKISFRYHGNKRNYKKTDVYGYRDRRGFNYRFYAGKSFRIDDTSGPYQYVRESLPSSKRLSQVNQKHYTSQSPDGAITETNPE